MVKKLSKRRQKQYDALWQRVADICTGACEFDVLEGKPGERPPIDVASLGRVLHGLKTAYPVLKSDALAYMTGTWNLEHYQTVDHIADFLFEHGIGGKIK